MRRLWILLASLLVAAIVGLTASCGGGDSGAGGTPVVTGVEGEVQTAIRQMVDRYNAKDVAGYIGSYTDAGLDKRYHLTRAEAAVVLPDVIGTPPIVIFRFQPTTVTGDTAAVDVLDSIGQVASEDQFKLVKEAGTWKIADYGRLGGSAGAGRVTVPVSIGEFTFDFDASLIKDGNVAFKFTNDGLLRHEIILDRIPADLNLDEALKTGKPPAGAETISFLGIAKPGETKRMVIDGTLAPGRYVFLSFMPDLSDPAHPPDVLKGMHAEFTVPETSPTASPSP